MNDLAPISGGVPGFLQEVRKVNDDVSTSAPFPHLSIKGKRFTVIKDGVKSVIMHPDRPHEVAQNLEIVVKRANTSAKVFYATKYEAGASDGAPPDCYSMDGVKPAANAKTPQHTNCAACPKNVWGARDGKGKECNDQVRLAISAAGDLGRDMLLRVPPASIKPFKDAIKGVKAKGGEYNTVIYRLGFDIEAESPKLSFTPISWVTQEQYAKINAAYDSPMVMEIVGLVDNGEENKPAAEANDLAPAPSFAAPKEEAKAPPPPAPAPKPEVKAAPPAQKATPPVDSGFLAELEQYLSGNDDA